MYKLEFTLKQHTPLIHFQHEQDGATLRASEVKPKLDKFLIEKLQLTTVIQENGKEKIIPKVQYESWFNNKEKLSLDYKLSFTAFGDNESVLEIVSRQKDGQTIFETKKFPMLLANMGGKEEKRELKNFSFYEKIKISIMSFNPELLSQINDNIGHFFILNNFGNRQNKGFGSFSIIDQDFNELEIIKEQYENVWYWEYNDSVDYEILFEDISNIYSLLKTGINFPDHPIQIINGRRRRNFYIKGKYQFYQKSFLFIYFLEQLKIGNEKRFIKENFFHPDVRAINDGMDKKYVRALLGVAPFNEYKDQYRYGTINIQSDEIERFQSPIIFKVFNNKVCFFIDNQNLKNINDKTFTFSDNHNSRRLSTPNKFFEKDLIGLLDGFLIHFNKIYDTIEDDLFEMYQNDERFPKALKSIIDTISYLDIKKYA